MNSQAKTENEPYTPTDEEARESYVYGRWMTGEPERHLAEFDRWLAQHDAEVLAAARPSWEAESREALVKGIAPFFNGWLVEKGYADTLAHDLASDAVSTLLVDGVVTLAVPAETDEVQEYIASSNDVRHTHEWTDAHGGECVGAPCTPVASQGDTPADEASECAGFDWGEWDGIDGPVLLCGVHGYPAQGEVYDRLPSQVGAACQAVDQPPAVPVDSEHEKRVSSIHSAREAVRAIRDVPVDAAGFPTEVGATFTARFVRRGEYLHFRVVEPGLFESLLSGNTWLTSNIDPASVEDVRRADDRSGK